MSFYTCLPAVIEISMVPEQLIFLTTEVQIWLDRFEIIYAAPYVSTYLIPLTHPYLNSKILISTADHLTMSSPRSPRKNELPIHHAQTQREHRNPHRNSINSHRSHRSSNRPHSAHYQPPQQLPHARTASIVKSLKSKIVKGHCIAASGEFIGTLMFLYFGFATHIMAVSEMKEGEGVTPQTVVFISLGYGFSLLVTVWVWYRISGGLFNPAVCLHSPFPLSHPHDQPNLSFFR